MVNAPFSKLYEKLFYLYGSIAGSLLSEEVVLLLMQPATWRLSWITLLRPCHNRMFATFHRISYWCMKKS